MLSSFDPVRLRRFPIEHGTILRISETVLNRDQCLANVTYSIYEFRDDQTYDYIVETQTNRYFQIAEMTHLAVRHNFKPCAYYNGFVPVEEINAKTWHVLAVWKSLGPREKTGLP